MAAKSLWQTVSLRPLTGLLDVRSRPADLPPGAMRWRQNWQTTSENKLCTRDGFTRAWSDFLYDNNGCLISSGICTGSGVYSHNHDLHHQGDTREPVTFLYESTASDATRRLFAGTQSRLYVLDEPTGYWTTIANGMGAGNSYWQGDCLQDTMIFCNGVDNVLQHTLGSATTSTIPDLIGSNIKAANVVVQHKGFIFLMNTTEGGARQLSRVRWCDLNLPLSWNAGGSSLAGYQDLDYGDEILAAKPMQDSLYIYTRRSIWRVDVSGSTTATWAFVRVYSEPKNQTGCLVYPRTLISIGSDHYYMSRDSVYHFNTFLPAPERQEWSRRADGVIYKKADTALSGVLCNSPCGEYRPGQRELWFSWPSGTNVLNNWTLVLNIEQQAADVVDAGFSAMVNYRRTPTLGLCNEIQDFLCASSTDWAIKSVGNGAFYREYITPVGNDLTADIDQDSPPAVYYTTGYYRILRGIVPLGFYDREKILRNVLVDHDDTAQDNPCVLRLRIGNSYTLCDPNDADDVCAPMWRQMADLPLSCPEPKTNTQLRAKNQKPYLATEWRTYESNIFIYWELTVANSDGTPAIGGDSCLERIDFDAKACVKP